MRLWRASDESIQDIGAFPSRASFYWSPDGRALLACNDSAGEPMPIRLWRDGELHDLETTYCRQRAWAADGRFALSGDAPRNDGNPNNPSPTAGKVFASNGTLQRELPVGVVVVGWQNNTLLSWAPQEDGRWQLRQAVGDADTLVGEPVDGAPFSPMLLAP